MFAPEKENLLHAGPQLQPGKVVGTTVNKLVPKTPMNQASKAPKTPFRMPLDREYLETVKKGLTQNRKPAFQLDPSAFVTPSGPRRIPLGGKTTNAKAPQSEHKEKLQMKLQQSPVTKTVICENEAEIPEIEYMPPTPIEIPDILDDFIEPNYELIKNNLFTGAYSAYLDERDENGKTKLDRKLDSVMEEQEKEMILEAEGGIGLQIRCLKKEIATKTGNSSTNTKLSSSSRPTSRICRQNSTKANAKRTTSVTRERSKTPSAILRPTSRVDQRNDASTSRPTSRSTSRSTSRPTSRVDTRPIGRVSRPTSAAATASKQRATSSTSRPTASQSSSRPVNAGNTGAMVLGPSVMKGQDGAIKTEFELLEEDADAALRELMYADTGYESDRVGLDDIRLDDDDFLFQLQC